MTNDMSEDERALVVYRVSNEWAQDTLAPCVIEAVDKAFLAGRASLKGELEELEAGNEKLWGLLFDICNAHGMSEYALETDDPLLSYMAGGDIEKALAAVNEYRKTLKETP